MCADRVTKKSPLELFQHCLEQSATASTAHHDFHLTYSLLLVFVSSFKCLNVLQGWVIVRHEHGKGTVTFFTHVSFWDKEQPVSSKHLDSITQCWKGASQKSAALFTCWMSLKSWLTSIIPPSKSLIASARASIVSMSKWLVGSSRKSMWGFCQASHAKHTRHFCPSERFRMGLTWQTKTQFTALQGNLIAPVPKLPVTRKHSHLKLCLQQMRGTRGQIHQACT